MSNTIDGPAGDVFVSTGELPGRDLVEGLVHEAHARYRANRDGEISRSYPALARVPEDLFGVCVVGTAGGVVAAGDADYEFTIMSISIHDGLSRFAGRELSLDTEVVYASASGTNSRNQSIARLLESFDRVYCPSADAVELYTLGTFAPPPDREGNSVKGQLVTKFLSSRLGLDLLISRPAGR